MAKGPNWQIYQNWVITFQQVQGGHTYPWKLWNTLIWDSNIYKKPLNSVLMYKSMEALKAYVNEKLWKQITFHFQIIQSYLVDDKVKLWR